MIDNYDIKRVTRYFDISSGYVPNQFEVRIYKRGVADLYQENAPNKKGIDYNPLYLINSEPWVVEEVTFPQIQLKQNNDIYVDANSLIKPNYVMGVETSGNITLVVREKSDLAIYRALLRCQAELYSNTYEYSGRNVFGEDYSLEIREITQRFDTKVLTTQTNNNVIEDNVILFDRVILLNISEPKLSYADRNFMRYTVTFETSSMAESYLSLVANKNVVRGITVPLSQKGTTNSNKDSRPVNSKTRESYGLPMPTFLQNAAQGVVMAVAAPIINDALKNASSGANSGVNGYMGELGNATVTDDQIKDAAGTKGLDITKVGSDMIQGKIDERVDSLGTVQKFILNY